MGRHYEVESRDRGEKEPKCAGCESLRAQLAEAREDLDGVKGDLNEIASSRGIQLLHTGARGKLAGLVLVLNGVNDDLRAQLKASEETMMESLEKLVVERRERAELQARLDALVAAAKGVVATWITRPTGGKLRLDIERLAEALANAEQPGGGQDTAGPTTE